MVIGTLLKVGKSLWSADKTDERRRPAGGGGPDMADAAIRVLWTHGDVALVHDLAEAQRGFATFARTETRLGLQ